MTLVWHDPPAMPSAGGPVLLNDLDLRVLRRSPDGTFTSQVYLRFHLQHTRIDEDDTAGWIIGGERRHAGWQGELVSRGHMNIGSMTESVRHAPPNNNSFIIGRSQTRRYNFDETVTTR